MFENEASCCKKSLKERRQLPFEQIFGEPAHGGWELDGALVVLLRDRHLVGHEIETDGAEGPPVGGEPVRLFPVDFRRHVLLGAALGGGDDVRAAAGKVVATQAEVNLEIIEGSQTIHLANWLKTLTIK